jgi:hypothetical protein
VAGRPAGGGGWWWSGFANGGGSTLDVVGRIETVDDPLKVLLALLLNVSAELAVVVEVRKVVGELVPDMVAFPEKVLTD